MNFIESNQQNSRLSTGPRTEEGKATIARNAMKHGGYAARSEALPFLGEDPAEYETLRLGLQQSLQPVGVLEVELVGKMTSFWWRMLRAGRVEQEGLEYAIRKFGAQSTPSFLAFCCTSIMSSGISSGEFLPWRYQISM